MSAHIRTKNLNEDRIIEIHSEKDPKEKRRKIRSLTKEGDFKRFRFMSRCGIDQIIAVRKAKIKDNPSRCCPNCKGFFSKKLFYRHAKTCTGACGLNPDNRNNVARSNEIISAAKLDLTDDRGFLKNILGPMRDDCRDICVKDRSLIALGLLLYQAAKNRTWESLRYRLRLLAKLKTDLSRRLGTPEVLPLCEYMSPKYFDVICTSVISASSDETAKIDRPSKIIAYGEVIGEYLQCLVGQAMRNEEGENEKEREEAKWTLPRYLKMRDLFAMEWKKKVTKEARFV